MYIPEKVVRDTLVLPEIVGKTMSEAGSVPFTAQCVAEFVHYALDCPPADKAVHYTPFSPNDGMDINPPGALFPAAHYFGHATMLDAYQNWFRNVAICLSAGGHLGGRAHMFFVLAADAYSPRAPAQTLERCYAHTVKAYQELYLGKAFREGLSALVEETVRTRGGPAGFWYGAMALDLYTDDYRKHVTRRLRELMA